MLHALRLALPLLAAIAAGSSAAAADLRVAPTGGAGGDGSAAKPFRQIREALAAVEPGDVIHVADGSYLGFDVAGVRGTWDRPITIIGEGDHVEITPTKDRQDDRDNIFVSRSSYVRLERLASCNAPRAGIRVSLSDHISVVAGRFGDCVMWGIFTDFADDLLLERNECWGVKVQHGIYVSNACVGAVVRRNRIHDNAGAGLHVNGDISLSEAGHYCDGQNRHMLVEGNVIWGNHAGSAINCAGMIDGTIRNNLIWNDHQAGICLYRGEAEAASRSVLITGNTVEISPTGKWPVQLHQGVSAVTVFNNILLDRHEHQGSFHLSETDPAGIASDHNILVGGDCTATLDDDATLTSFAEWQATGHDQHSLTASRDELFVAPDAGDYRLKEGCPAIDAGIPELGSWAAPVVDALGARRPTGRGCDIGAFEAPEGHASR